MHSFLSLSSCVRPAFSFLEQEYQAICSCYFFLSAWEATFTKTDPRNIRRTSPRLL